MYLEFLFSMSATTQSTHMILLLLFSLLRPLLADSGCEESSVGCGLEDGGGRLLGTGVELVLDSCSLRAVLNEGALACVARLDGAGPGVLLKKPAMLCCLPPDFCVEPPVFLGAVRGVAISLPSIPRAIVYRWMCFGDRQQRQQGQCEMDGETNVSLGVKWKVEETRARRVR